MDRADDGTRARSRQLLQDGAKRICTGAVEAAGGLVQEENARAGK
jgi:hypothetical protein